MNLEKKFLFYGTLDELKEQLRLQNNQRFQVKWIDYKSFKVLSNFSTGTIIFNFTPSIFEGIKGYADLDELESGKIKVTLRTKVRVELYIFLCIMIIGIAGSLLTDNQFPVWFSLLTPIVLIWFWFVYRVQEKALFKKVETYLKQ